MSLIVFNGEDPVIVGTANNTITGVITNGFQPITLNYHSPSANTTITALNPHIGDVQTISVALGTADAPLIPGDLIQLHSDDETYDAEILTYTRGAAGATVRIVDVEDPIVYPSTRINANSTNVTHSGNDTIVILPDDGNAPTETFPEADYDDIIQSWSISAIRANGESISFSFSVSGVVDDVPLGFDGISFNHTNRHFIFHFEDAGGNTAAENSSAFGELFDGSTDLVGTDDHFFIEFSYHDHDAITSFSWEKPLVVSQVIGNNTFDVFPHTLNDTDRISAGDNVTHLFLE